MVDSYVGEIRMMGNVNGKVPNNWALCNGALLQVSEYQALFAVIGTIYGGNGTTNFGLPDLRGRLPMGQGNGAGLTPRTIAQTTGSETVLLQTANTPPHTHAFNTAGVPASTPTTGSTVTFANTASPTIQYLKDGLGTAGGTPVATAPITVATAGSGTPHANVMPCATVNFIICTIGLFPQRGS